ncbi:hypothetical protein EBA03_02365 [Xanthomonas oryzae pv. oryzae]|nr:hypothetical protein EBA03_02365 [Xanthomonas oryzae pv. oryzae]
MARCERSARPHGDVARRQTRPSKLYSTCADAGCHTRESQPGNSQPIHQGIQPLSHRPISQSANQPISQSANQPISQSANQPINQSTNQPINQSTNQPINQSTNQPINQSTNQPINQSTARPPTPSSQRNQIPATRHSPAFRAGQHRMSRPFRNLRWQCPLGGGCVRGRVLDSAASLRVFPQQGRRSSCRLLVPVIFGCCSLPLRLRRPRGGMCARSRPSMRLTGQCRLSQT